VVEGNNRQCPGVSSFHPSPLLLRAQEVQAQRTGSGLSSSTSVPRRNSIPCHPLRGRRFVIATKEARSSTWVGRASYTGPVDQTAGNAQQTLQVPWQCCTAGIQPLGRDSICLADHNLEGRMLAVGSSRMAGTVGHEWPVREYAKKGCEWEEEHQADTQHR
jgi:hypothetical protein